jgi:ribosome-associated protein
MHDDEETQEFADRPPSKSMRKRDATAAQALGTRLIELNETELRALGLDEILFDALVLAKRITSRGGLARQRQYIGKLMREIDVAPIEAALNTRSKHQVVDAEKHKRIETWRARLLTEGPAALDELLKWVPDADRKSLQVLIAKASAKTASTSRETASRELFRTLRGLFDGVS